MQIENNYKNLNDLNELSYMNKFLNNELTCYSFVLPNLERFEDYKFKEYLQNDLLELPAQFNLHESGHLNWWTENNWENVCRPLFPMVTSGDGNCLLHAASLAMWGLHDRYLILRKALNSTLKQIKEDNTNALWRRWKWEQMCQNRKYGLIYDEDEWSKEWNSLLKLSSYQPRMAAAQNTVWNQFFVKIYKKKFFKFLNCRGRMRQALAILVICRCMARHCRISRRRQASRPRRPSQALQRIITLYLSREAQAAPATLKVLKSFMCFCWQTFYKGQLSLCLTRCYTTWMASPSHPYQYVQNFNFLF